MCANEHVLNSKNYLNFSYVKQMYDTMCVCNVEHVCPHLHKMNSALLNYTARAYSQVAVHFKRQYLLIFTTVFVLAIGCIFTVAIV